MGRVAAQLARGSDPERIATAPGRRCGVGTLRGDVNPSDVIGVIHGIWYLPSGPEWREDVGRMLELVIDGLRYGVPERRPQPAP